MYSIAELPDVEGVTALISETRSAMLRALAGTAAFLRANAAPWDTQCLLEKQSFMHIIGRANLLSARGYPPPAADFKRPLANNDDEEPRKPFGYGPGARSFSATRERCAQCATRDHANGD